MMSDRVLLQMTEACGPVNQWFCSQYYGEPVHNAETLLVYFVKSGGAADFAVRYSEAMGPLNRWYCSEYYGRDVRDPMVLWDYYMNRQMARLSVAC
jgi:hypothetical protein